MPIASLHIFHFHYSLLKFLIHPRPFPFLLISPTPVKKSYKLCLFFLKASIFLFSSLSSLCLVLDHNQCNKLWTETLYSIFFFFFYKTSSFWRADTPNGLRAAQIPSAGPTGFSQILLLSFTFEFVCGFTSLQSKVSCFY